VQQDSAKLSDDSATVETAKGVKREEKSAQEQEKADGEKLKKGEKKK